MFTELVMSWHDISRHQETNGCQITFLILAYRPVVRWKMMEEKCRLRDSVMLPLLRKKMVREINTSNTMLNYALYTCMWSNNSFS